MINKRTILPLLICTLFLSSCFETIVDIELEEVDPKLVIGAVIDFSRETQLIHISETYSRLELFENLNLNGINCTIYDPNGNDFLFEAIDVAPDSPAAPNLIYRGYFPPQEGQYLLEVTSNDHNSIFAKATLPDKVEIINAELVGKDGDIPKLHVTFNDPLGTNFYHIRFLFKIESGTYSFSLNTIDISADNFFDNNGFLVSDESFDGQQKTIIFNVSSWKFDSVLDIIESKVELISISEEQYNYDKNLRLNEEASRNPYLEEIPVIGNIDGGFGLFSLSYSDEFVIEI